MNKTIKKKAVLAKSRGFLSFFAKESWAEKGLKAVFLVDVVEYRL